MNWLELFASEYRVYAQHSLSWVLIISAFIWGGGPERAVAATWLICFKANSWINHLFFGTGRQLLEIDLFWAFGDLLAAFCWIVIALYANRNYTLWIAGLQILAVSAHAARGLAEAVSPIGYMVMVVAPGWFQLFLLAVGLIRHVRRKRKFGSYRDWRITRKAHNSGQFTDGPSLFTSVLGPSNGSWRDELK